MKRIVVVAAAALMALAIAGPAAAHVTATPDEGPAEGFFKTDFRVGHGCDGKPTTKISMQVPGNVSSVHPQVVTGWDIDTKIGKLDEPIESHGETITEGVREITWTSTEKGGLPDAHMQEFGVSMALPAGEEGEPLWFPFVQECPGGASNEWIEIPETVEEWGDLESPAPYVVLTAAEGEHDAAEAEETATANGDGAAMTEEQIRTIAAEEADDNSNVLIAWFGVILGAIGVAFGITATMRARSANK
jgi:periplasmic copper chaperone A